MGLNKEEMKKKLQELIDKAFFAGKLLGLANSSGLYRAEGLYAQYDEKELALKKMHDEFIKEFVENESGVEQ